MDVAAKLVRLRGHLLEALVSDSAATTLRREYAGIDSRFERRKRFLCFGKCHCRGKYHTTHEQTKWFLLLFPQVTPYCHAA